MSRPISYSLYIYYIFYGNYPYMKLYKDTSILTCNRMRKIYSYTTLYRYVENIFGKFIQSAFIFDGFCFTGYFNRFSLGYFRYGLDTALRLGWSKTIIDGTSLYSRGLLKLTVFSKKKEFKYQKLAFI